MTNKEIILPLMGPTISLLVTRPLSFNSLPLKIHYHFGFTNHKQYQEVLLSLHNYVDIFLIFSSI